MAATSPRFEHDSSFASPQEEALLTLMRSADRLHRSLQLRLKPFGLTATQYNVLRILRGAQPAGLTCSAIGDRMITPEPDITRLLARLKARKLLSQHRDKHDRRVVWTRIGDLGLAVLAELDGIVGQAPGEMLSALTCAEVTELIRLLNKAQGRDSQDVSDSAKAPVTGSQPSPRLLPRLPLHPHRPE